MLTDLLYPATDAGALGQLIAVVLGWVLLVFTLRRRREWVLLVSGLALVTLGWFALRSLH